MEAMMNAQSAGNPMADMMKMMSERKIIEYNPYHPIINKMSKMTGEDASDEDKEKAATTIATLFQTALIESGFGLNDPSAYVSEVQNVMATALGIEDANELVDIEIVEI